MTKQYIETEYKDCPPEQTVENIRERLAFAVHRGGSDTL